MAEPVDTPVTLSPSKPGAGTSNLIKMGAVAAFSAFVGGLAAAWFYRQTLARLQEAGESPAKESPHPEEGDYEL